MNYIKRRNDENDSRSGIGGWTAVLGELLLPSICPICQKTLGDFARLGIHPGCRLSLEYVMPPFCNLCGKPLLTGSDALGLRGEFGGYCRDCRELRSEQSFRGFDQGRAVFLYSCVQQGLLDLKYHNYRRNAIFFGEEMARVCGKYVLEQWKPDVLIPIPVHKKRLRQRGYNQAELICDVVSRSLGIPMRTDLLIRTRNTTAQKSLNDQERILNLREAFALKGDASDIESAVLIDDVFTTGATIAANAGILKKAGVKKVYFLTAAIGAGN